MPDNAILLKPTLQTVGYELRPSKTWSNSTMCVWEFAPDDSNSRHRQRKQEELYAVLNGGLQMEADLVTNITVPSGGRLVYSDITDTRPIMFTVPCFDPCGKQAV